MKLLIKRYSSDQNWCDDIDYGYIELTKDLAKLILERIEKVKQLRDSEEKDLSKPYAIIYKDICVEFIDLDDDDDEYYQVVQAEGAYSLPDNFVLEDERIHRTELNEMRVEDDEVSWRAVIKHTDVVVETKGLPVELLERIACVDPVPI